MGIGDALPALDQKPALLGVPFSIVVAGLAVFFVFRFACSRPRRSGVTGGDRRQPGVAGLVGARAGFAITWASTCWPGRWRGSPRCSRRSAGYPTAAKYFGMEFDAIAAVTVGGHALFERGKGSLNGTLIGLRHHRRAEERPQRAQVGVGVARWPASVF